MVFANNRFLRCCYVMMCGFISVWEGLVMMMSLGFYAPGWKLDFSIFMLIREGERELAKETNPSVCASDYNRPCMCEDCQDARDFPDKPLPEQWNCQYCSYGEYVQDDRDRAFFRRNEHEFFCTSNPDEDYNYKHPDAFYGHCQKQEDRAYKCVQGAFHTGACRDVWHRPKEVDIHYGE